MAIQILSKDGKDHPFIYCDHCGLEIFDAEQGNAIWLGDPEKREGFRFDVGYVHHECGDDFLKARPAPHGSKWFLQGLNHHFHLLLKNSEYNDEKGRPDHS